MSRQNRAAIPDIDSDPFQERSTQRFRRTLQIMGGRFHFESDSRELMRLVGSAYSGVPAHRFASSSPGFRVRLMVTPGAPKPAGKKNVRGRSEPAPISMLHGAGMLGAATESATFVVLSPEHRTALVSVSRPTLAFPYHIRYELLEFAVFALASRAQQLVPLHAACVGVNGKGILLMGASGSGKTTIALQCLFSGFEFLSEDSVFVAPGSLRATGTANFLHVRKDSLRWVDRSQATLIRRSPVIRRRSGAEKFEVDIRRKQFRLAPAPLEIVGIAYLTSKQARTSSLLRSVSTAASLRRLAGLQGYASGLPQWREFCANLRRAKAFEVHRGKHPLETVAALQSALSGG